MTDKYNPYPTYKPSGIPWLGDMPAHWEIARLKRHVANVIDITDNRKPDETYIALEHVESWTGMVSDAGNHVQFDSRVKRFRVGDVLFGKLNPYLAKVASPNRNGVCVGEFLVLRRRDYSFTSSYLEYLLRSKPIIDAIDSSAFGATMPRADWDFIGSMRFPLPPPPEQAAITRHLDRANERIRRYISAKRKLIDLLEEEKQATIHRAVTRGLDDGARLEPSGVEWLGDVPAHWEVRRLKSVCSQSGLYGANIASTHYQESGIRFLRTTDITDDGQLRKGGVFLHKELVEGYILEDGDILISRSGTVGRSFLYQSRLHGPCSYAGYLVRFVPGYHAIPKYIFLFTKTQAFEGFLHAMAISSTIKNVNADKYANAHIPLPPLPEQAAIVEYLDKATANIDAAIARARRLIELLEEYRTRLIADVVTGKLDVRDAAASLPGES